MTKSALAVSADRQLTPDEVVELEETCRRVRRLIVREIGNLGIGHLGGSLSIVEALVTVYHRHLRADPADPKKQGRDRFVLSKGHGGPGLYAVLSDRGFFPEDLLWTLNQPGTTLPSHPDMNKTPGVDMTTGSLGQGFSAATGIAAAARLAGDDAYVYTLIGDGESQEGQIWEAALYAAHLGLDNLIAFTDYNDKVIDGPLHEINDLRPLANKWEAFRWNTVSVDGHDVAAIDEAIRAARATKGKPSMIILNTIKGHGVGFVEALGVANHNMPISPAQLEAALAELEGK